MLVLPSLLFLSGNLNGQFLHVLSPPPASGHAHVKPAEGATIPDMPDLDFPLDREQIGINLPTPSSITLQQSVQTAGVNGATSMLANEITQLAQQQLAGGTINQAQYNSLIGLSNEGHRLASALGLIEDAFSHGGRQDPYDKIVRFDGKTVRVGELANDIGFGDRRTPMPTDPLRASYRASGVLKQFLGAYQDSLTSGALNDPAIKQQIGMLASEIVTASHSLDMALYDYDDDKIKARDITNQAASQLTNLNSIVICQTGNGTDSGHQCQP